jgi:hypothetical protein
MTQTFNDETYPDLAAYSGYEEEVEKLYAIPLYWGCEKYGGKDALWSLWGYRSETKAAVVQIHGHSLETPVFILFERNPCSGVATRVPADVIRDAVNEGADCAGVVAAAQNCRARSAHKSFAFLD